MVLFQLATDVARILDTARIPYVMFGLWPVGCHGTDHSTTEIDFVIDEDKIPAAATALVATGHFQRCADDNCLERTPDRRDRSGMFPGRLYPADVLARQMAPNNYHAIAQEHLHIGPGYEYFQVISLYAKSHLLWSFPDLTLDAGDPRTYMYTNDAQLPPRTQGGSTGPWDTLYPVKIPTHVALVEALCLLYLRDLGDFTHLHDTWSGMLNGALGQQFIDADLNLTERAKALRRNVNPRWLPGLDPFFFPTRAEPVFAGLNRLRATLLQNNELPDIPPHDLSDCPM
ncbi:hypothetical protein BJY00DRAFT_318533 [Aspergillus carlsbadensis]|nr:hypothetical protein BJY00DRAFT_318533 [Aspergillus carlsbadensis]